MKRQFLRAGLSVLLTSGFVTVTQSVGAQGGQVNPGGGVTTGQVNPGGVATGQVQVTGGSSSSLPGVRLPGAVNTGATTGAALGTSPPGNAGTALGANTGIGVNAGTGNSQNGFGSLNGGKIFSPGSQSQLSPGSLNGAGLKDAQQGLKTGSEAFQNNGTTNNSGGLNFADFMEAQHGPEPGNAGIPFGDDAAGGSGSSGNGGNSGNSGNSGGSSGGSSGSSGSGGSSGSSGSGGGSSGSQGNPTGGATGSGIFAPSEINPFGRTGARAVDRVQDAVSGGAFQNTGVNLNNSEGVRLFSQPGGGNADAGAGFKNGSPFAPGGRFSGVASPGGNLPGGFSVPNRGVSAGAGSSNIRIPGAAGLVRELGASGGSTIGGAILNAPGRAGLPGNNVGGGAVIQRLPGFTINGSGALPGAGIKVPVSQPVRGIRVNLPNFSAGAGSVKIPTAGAVNRGALIPNARTASPQLPNIVVPVRK